MQSLQTPFLAGCHPPVNFHPRKLPVNIGRSSVYSCRNSDGGNGDEPSSSSSSSSPSARRQEILAKIAMLQAQKVRLTDFLDERSTYLTQFAQDADAGFDQIGEAALRELDEAESRILESIEKRMQAFEENAQSNRAGIENSEQKLAEFEDKIEEDRNQGLFFKNLGDRTKPPAPPPKDQMEMRKKFRRLEREAAGSRMRRSIYLAMILLLTAALCNALFVSSPAVEWPKIAVLGLIMAALIVQLAYEKSLSISSAADEKALEEIEEEE